MSTQKIRDDIAALFAGTPDHVSATISDIKNVVAILLGDADAPGDAVPQAEVVESVGSDPAVVQEPQQEPAPVEGQ